MSLIVQVLGYVPPTNILLNSYAYIIDKKSYLSVTKYALLSNNIANVAAYTVPQKCPNFRQATAMKTDCANARCNGQILSWSTADPSSMQSNNRIPTAAWLCGSTTALHNCFISIKSDCAVHAVDSFRLSKYVASWSYVTPSSLQSHSISDEPLTKASSSRRSVSMRDAGPAVECDATWRCLESRLDVSSSSSSSNDDSVDNWVSQSTHDIMACR